MDRYHSQCQQSYLVYSFMLSALSYWKSIATCCEESQQHKNIGMVLLGQVKVHLVQCPASDSGCPVRQRQYVATSSIPPLPTLFSSGCFLSWKFLAVNSTEFLLCALSQSSLVTSAHPWQPLQWVPQVLLTHAQTFLLKLDFVCCCLHFWESVNNWCYGNQCPFTLSWLLMDRLVHSLFVRFFKLRCSCIPSFLHWCTLSLLAFFWFKHILLKRDQNCRNIKNAGES